MKVVAIHQPNYLPWLGYFYKIWASDAFVLHDNVEYTKQSFTKRVFIRQSSHTTEHTYLSVPLKKHSDYALIKDLEICHEQHWQAKHLNKIYNAYHKAPYFEQYFPYLAQTIVASRSVQHLKTLNLSLLLTVLDCLNIKTQLYFSSELPVSGCRADAYNAAIVQYCKGNMYISGAGGIKYQAEYTYNHLGIDLNYMRLGIFLKMHPPQYPVPFLAGLSILDALFYIGEAGILQIFNHYKEYEINKGAAEFVSQS